MVVVVNMVIGLANCTSMLVVNRRSVLENTLMRFIRFDSSVFFMFSASCNSCSNVCTDRYLCFNKKFKRKYLNGLLDFFL